MAVAPRRWHGAHVLTSTVAPRGRSIRPRRARRTRPACACATRLTGMPGRPQAARRASPGRSRGQSMGELTAQVGMSECRTWYENEFQVSYETWPQTRSFSYQVLQSSFLENSEIPT